MKKIFVVVGAIGFVSAGVVAGLYTHQAVQDQFNVEVVQRLEDAGYQVTTEIEGVSIWSQELRTSQFELAKNTVTVSIEGASFDNESVRFESLSLSEGAAGELLSTGSGKAAFASGRASLEVNDVVNAAAAQPTNNNLLNQYNSADISASLADKGSDSSELTLQFDLEGIGRLNARASLNGSVPWDKAPEAIAKHLASSVPLQEVLLSYTDLGGLGGYISSLAVGQGIDPSQAQSAMAEALRGASMPNKYRTPLADFVQSPGTLSVRLAPVSSSVSAQEIVGALTMVGQGLMHPEQAMAKVDVTIESSPK